MWEIITLSWLPFPEKKSDVSKNFLEIEVQQLKHDKRELESEMRRMLCENTTLNVQLERHVQFGCKIDEDVMTLPQPLCGEGVTQPRLQQPKMQAKDNCLPRRPDASPTPPPPPYPSTIRQALDAAPNPEPTPASSISSHTLWRPATTLYYCTYLISLVALTISRWLARIALTSSLRMESLGTPPPEEGWTPPPRCCKK